MHAITTQFHNDYKRVLAGALVLFVILIIAYVYFVNATIQHVVARKNLEAATELLSSQVSDLEFSYIRYQNDITPDYVAQNGFVESQQITYVSRRPAAVALSLNR